MTRRTSFPLRLPEDAPAALASCAAGYLAGAGSPGSCLKRKFRDKKACLLYSADFSGIQKFLFTVATKGALPSLRSRSFFLELLMEHYIDELLSACGASRVNLLYAGGGHCYILLPNTPQVLLSITAWNTRFNDWLAGQFGISLFLADGWTGCSGNELMNIPAERQMPLHRHVPPGQRRHCPPEALPLYAKSAAAD